MTTLLIQLNDVEPLYTIAIVLSGAALYVITKIFRTNNQKRQDTQEQFNLAVQQLSQDNETSQLSAAIILRRFFDAVIDKERFRKETINVISSMLKIHPTGIYQKTLGDGLAYAGNLNYADLQRTNMQDLYLGKKNEKDDELEKKGITPNNIGILRKILMYFGSGFSHNDDLWKITMDFTDMYGANLSYALVENIIGFGTIFNSAIFNHTNIKNCIFRKADFKYSDLTNVYFENVILEGSDFKGAKGIPKEMIKHLKWINQGTKDEAYIYEGSDVFIMDKSKKKGGGHKMVFFSMPGTLTASEEALTLYYKKILEGKGIEAIIYKRDHYPKDSQLTKVKESILQSDAMIAFGLKQIEIKSGRLNPDKKEFEEGLWLPTPWNEIEVGMGVMANLPILLVRDDKIEIGVFDKVISEYQIKSLSSATPLENVETNDEFKKWLAMFTNEKYEIEITDEMKELADRLAEYAHNTLAKDKIIRDWSNGEVHNDVQMHHPNQVSYKDLPEEEKKLKRELYLKTLKSILEMGFRIEK